MADIIQGEQDNSQHGFTNKKVLQRTINVDCIDALNALTVFNINGEEDLVYYQLVFFITVNLSLYKQAILQWLWLYSSGTEY